MTKDVLEISTDRYVFYNDKGEIVSISNSNDRDENFIKLPIDRVIDFLTGKTSTSKYVIEYDSKIKKAVLKEKPREKKNSFSIKNVIFQIQEKLSRADLNVTKNIKTKKWIFWLDEEYRNFLKENTNSSNAATQYSITKKNDSSVLVRLILINNQKLIENKTVEIDFQYEEEREDASIYTVKKFDTYSLEVIDE